jgi:hypothetical protein
MKFYKARGQRLAPNQYYIRHKKYHYGDKGSVTLYHCLIKDGLAFIQPSSVNVSKEELRWDYLECAGIACSGIKSVMY